MISHEYREIRNQKTLQAVHSIDQSFSMSPLAEALGEMSLPLPLEVVATDKSLVGNEGAVRNIGAVGGNKEGEL